jgi:hypothetical protein
MISRLTQHSQRRCCVSQTALLSFEVLPDMSQAIPGLSPALPGPARLVIGTPRLVASAPSYSEASRNALLGSDILLKLLHLSLHSTSSQTLLEAPSD